MQLIHGGPAVMRKREEGLGLGLCEMEKGEKRERKVCFFSSGFLSNDGAVVVLSPHFPNEKRGLAWRCLFVSICHPALFLKKKYGIKIRQSESAFHLHSRPQFSSLPFSSDCFLHIQQPPRGQSRDLWCAHQWKGILSNNFATLEADLSTCLLNHCWKKVGATLLCSAEGKNNAAVKSFHLIQLYLCMVAKSCMMHW